MKFDYIECGDSAKLLGTIPPESIDLTVTSPPYDDLRTYDGYCFDFKTIANELFRVTKEGGVVVWIVADGVVDGSESGTSFKQVLYFQSIGFNIHDTMIWKKDTSSFPDPTRYMQSFEYMFVLSKGKPKTINKICDRINKWYGTQVHGTSRAKDGSVFRKSNDKKTNVKMYGERFNVWEIPTEKNNTTGHPAVFPSKLVRDHIISWSNEGDVVLDVFLGSGTTAIEAIKLQRHFVGFEISQKYFEIARERIQTEQSQITIFDILRESKKD